MAKIISSLPGLVGNISRTSQLINDGADNTSTYVETDELGFTAFSNDYNDLDNLPIGENQDLQSVLDNGSYAEVDGGNSSVSLLEGSLNERGIHLGVFDGANANSSLSMNVSGGGSQISLEGSSDNNTSSVSINGGNVYISHQNIIGSTSFSLPESPTNTVAFILPTKNIDGAYTLATLDDIPSSSLFVPYIGATTNIDLGEFQIKTGQVEFDQTPTGTFGVGNVRWNDSDGTVEIMLKGGNVTLQVGQEQLLRVVNKTGVNLLESEYKVVYISGAQGNRLKVDLALANNTVNSNKTIGLVTENITNNNEGFITTSGLVRNINTTGSLQSETWVDGDVLYVSPTILGGLTNVMPVSPNHKVLAGYVVRAHITQGSIFVKVDTGLSLGEIHDVKLAGTTSGKVLGSTIEGIWENKTIEDVLGYSLDNFIPLSGTIEGNPVTGDIEYSGNKGSKYNFYDNYFIIKGNEDEDLAGVFLKDELMTFGVWAGNTLSERLRLDASTFRIQSSNHSISANPFSSITITDNELFRGLTGEQDFSPNITDLDYPQKIYVDTAIDTAIGGITTPTLQEVTTTGNTTTNNITANSFIKSLGTASQFLKADGSVDSNTYLTSSSNYWTKTGDDIKNNNIGNTQIQIQPTKQTQFLNSAGTQVGFIDENGTYRAGTATQYVTVGLLGGNTWMSMVRLQASMGVILGNPQVNQAFTTISTNYFGSSYVAGSNEVAAIANAEHSFNIGNSIGDGITSGIFRIGRTRLQSTVPVKYATDLSGSYDNRTLVDKEYVDIKTLMLNNDFLLYSMSF